MDESKFIPYVRPTTQNNSPKDKDWEQFKRSLPQQPTQYQQMPQSGPTIEQIQMQQQLAWQTYQTQLYYHMVSQQLFFQQGMVAPQEPNSNAQMKKKRKQAPNNTPFGNKKGLNLANNKRKVPLEYGIGPEIRRCEGCDKTFNVKKHYDQHMRQHQKCQHCDFQAIPKVLSVHEVEEHPFLMKHKSISLDTQEEIDQWIAERKRKYPGANNNNNAPENTEANENSENTEPVPKLKICKFFLKNKCKKGDNCNFSHGPVEDANRGVESLYAKLQNQDIAQDRKFIVEACKLILLKNFMI